MGKKGTTPFYDWIDQINEANSGISQYSNTYPNTSFHKLDRKVYKELVYRNTYNRLLNIVLRMFKWKTPDNINPRILELGLITRGYMCVFRDNGMELGLPCIPNNMYNIYGDPTSVNVFGFNGYTKAVTLKYRTDIPIMNRILEMDKGDKGTEGVFCRDNEIGYAYINYVREYAYKLTDKLIALDIATQRLKSPFIYVIDEIELKDSLEDLVEKIEGNEDTIIRLKQKKIGVESEAVEVHDSKINPDVIMAIKSAILFDFDMFLEILGINTNPSPDKSQVVLNSELNSNNMLIDLQQDVRFLNRQKFCEDLKAIMGIKMSVEKNVEEVAGYIKSFKKGVEDEEDDNAGAPQAPGRTL